MRIDIKLLCNIAWVSVSWYYKYRKLILTNQTKRDREKYDLDRIKALALKIIEKIDIEWLLWNY